MTWFMGVLIFIGGIGCGIVLLMLFLLFKVKDRKSNPRGLLVTDVSDRPCSHRFFKTNLFQGEVEICSICGWTILSSSLIKLNERDAKIAARLLEELGSATRIDTLTYQNFAANDFEDFDEEDYDS